MATDGTFYEQVTPKMYRQQPEEWWKRQTLRTVRPLNSGVARISAGTLCTVERKFKGFSLLTAMCDHCGVQIRMTRVDTWDVEIQFRK